jgi:hAT family C-terminal dimerisation region
MENLLVKAAETGAVNTDDVKAVCDHFDGDLKPDRLVRQLAVLGDIFAGKNVTSIAQLIHNLREMGSAANLFTEVLLLLRLYLVLPASVATAERNFSALRRMKTYLRSTMTCHRLQFGYAAECKP